MREPDHRQVVPVQAAKRCVQADVQVRSQRIFDAVHRVGVAVHADQRVVDVGISGVKRDLHRVQAGGVQVLAHHAGQHPAIGVQAGDKPLCRLHELDQIVAQRRFAARKGQLRNAGVAAFFNDGQPLVGVQLRHGGKRLVGGVAVQAFLVAVPRAVLDHRADHQVHAVGRGHPRCIIGQTDRFNRERRLTAAGNRAQAVHKRFQVALDLRVLGLAVNFAGRSHGLRVDGAPLLRAYLLAGVGL